MRSLSRPTTACWRASFLACLLLAGCVLSAPPAPPILTVLPDFSLVDANGAVVTRQSLSGRPLIADFVFTRCPAACPRLTARMKELLGQLSASSLVRLVSISVDPEHDRPEVLAEYAARWEIRDPRWLFLTGERGAIWSLIREGFLLPVEAQDDPANPVLHTNRFALVDASGNLRGTYEAFESGALDRLLADLATLEREEAR
mgnify:CR=1 FL=1